MNKSWCSYIVLLFSLALILFELPAFIANVFNLNYLIKYFSLEMHEPTIEIYTLLSSATLILLNKENISFLRRLFAQIFIAIIFIGTVTNILQYEFNFNFLHIKVPLLTAICFFLMSTSLLFIDSRLLKTEIKQFIIVITFLLSLLSLLGYLFNIDSRYKIDLIIRMDIETSLIIFTLCIGILFLRPHRGFIGILFEKSLGGSLLRRVPATVFFISMLITIVVNKGHEYGLYDDSFGDILTLCSTIIILIITLWFNAILLDREEKKRKGIEYQLGKNIELVKEFTENINEMEKKIVSINEYDSLTGLLNKATLQSKLNQKIIEANRNHTQIAIIILDLDKFLLITNAMGYDASDLLIQQVVDRFAHLNLSPSSIVSRLTNAKFVILPENINTPNQASEFSLKIFSLFEESFHIKGKEFFIMVSIGISFFPKDGNTVDDLLKHANLALSEAKNENENSFHFFTKKLSLNLFEKLTLESDLRNAISKNEFQLYYQPKVDLKTGMISSIESLIRWNHPQKGLISPNLFIPLAEESDIIIPITEWVIREVFSLIAENKLTVPVAINISPRHFREDYNLSGYLKQMIKGFHIHPNQIELEITETVLMYDIEHILFILANLKSIGFTLTLDDFGTKFSSLNYLTKIAIDKVKIDKSFIDNYPNMQDNIPIIKAIIALFHTLNKKIIAEGAETAEQVSFLAAEGCDEVQGYYFSKPLSLEEIIKIINSHKTWKIP